jgi:hypothetical protein
VLQKKKALCRAFEVDLIDALSHPEVADRLEALSAFRPSRTASVRRPPSIQTRLGYSAVLDAVTAVMPADGALRFIEVHALVEEELGHDVPKSSVKNALARNSRGTTPKFVRVDIGFYRRS